MREWETPDAALARVGATLDMLFLALEQAAAAATDLCHESGIDVRRFPHTWCDLVRTFAWTRDLDRRIADKELYAFTEGNAGIAVSVGLSTVRVLHEYEGKLPRAQSEARRQFYRQPDLSLFSFRSTPRRVDHLVALWGYGPVEGLWMTLVAPRHPDALDDPIWMVPISHPYDRVDASLVGVTRLYDHTDDVDEVEPLTQPASAEDDVDEVEPAAAAEHLAIPGLEQEST